MNATVCGMMGCVLLLGFLPACKASSANLETGSDDPAEDTRNEPLNGAGPAHVDKTLSTGRVRVYYGSTTPAACDAILIGVGTAMSTDGYEKLSTRLTSHGYVVAILDHNPGNLIKTDSKKYRNLAVEVKTKMIGWIPGSKCSSVAHWILGGHSAGGQAAQGAISKEATLADAIFSIDPYDATAVGNVNVPAMYWGFDVTTCFVDKNKAAKAAYDHSLGLRAFYRVAVDQAWGACGYAPRYFHCSFADNDCPGCTDCMDTPDSFYDDVGQSVHSFIHAAFYGTWSKNALTIASTTPLTLYTGNDQP